MAGWGISSPLAESLTPPGWDSGYVFVLVWSFAGIALKQAGAMLFTLGLALYSIVARRRVVSA